MGLPRWSISHAGSSLRLKLPHRRGRNIQNVSTGTLGIWEDYRGYKFITDHHSPVWATHLSIQVKKWICCNKKKSIYNTKVKQEQKITNKMKPVLFKKPQWIWCINQSLTYITLIEKISLALSFYNCGEDCFGFFQCLVFIETPYIQNPAV